MIVHVLSGWLASSYAIPRAFLREISWRVSVESAINKRKSSCHFAWRNGSIAAWMFVHPTNTAVILDLKGFLINQKLFLSTSEYHHNYQGRMWNMPDFWNRLNNSLSNVYRLIWSCRVFFLTVVPVLAFLILLQQLQEKTSSQKIIFALSAMRILSVYWRLRT